MAEDRQDRAEPDNDDTARPRGGGPDSAKSLGSAPTRGSEVGTPKGGGPDSAKGLSDDPPDANQDGDEEEEPTPRKFE